MRLFTVTKEKLYTLSERAKLSFLGLLLLLMLGTMAFTAVNTFHAVRSFQQQYKAVSTEDVRAIHPWMTIHVISDIYHVPEDDLYSSLNIGSPKVLRHATLYDIANRKRQPVDQVIHTVQHAILAYRKKHPQMLKPTPQHNMRPAAPTPGRTKY